MVKNRQIHSKNKASSKYYNLDLIEDFALIKRLFLIYMSAK